MEFEFLEKLREDWQPLSRPALIAWLVFYALVLLHTLTARGAPLYQLVFLPIHEAGHPLFSYLGTWPGILGGTLLQLGVPLALAAHFTFQRQPPGVAFCAFFLFANFLDVATYMADARRQELPLVTLGGGDPIHDWYFLFSSLGLLRYDTAIAGVVRFLGWLGMLATTGWLVLRHYEINLWD
jgi:hypothetical protein